MRSLATRAFFGVLGAMFLVLGIEATSRVVAASTAWPANAIAACSDDEACVASLIVTDAPLVWLGVLWLVGIVAIFGFGFRAPSVQGAPESIKRRIARQRTAHGQRIGHAVGWSLTITMLAMILVLLGSKILAPAIAFATWSDARIDRCSDDPACTISTLSNGAVPVWVGVVAVGVILIGMIVCWKPARWWQSSSGSKLSSALSVETFPAAIAVHSGIAVFFALVQAGVLKLRSLGDGDVYAPEYLWVALGALTLVAIATVRHRQLVGNAYSGLRQSSADPHRAAARSRDRAPREPQRPSDVASRAQREAIELMNKRQRNTSLTHDVISGQGHQPSVYLRYPRDWLWIPEFGPGEIFATREAWATAAVVDALATDHDMSSPDRRLDLTEQLIEGVEAAATRSSPWCLLYFEPGVRKFRVVEAETISAAAAGRSSLAEIAGMNEPDSLGDQTLPENVAATGLDVVFCVRTGTVNRSQPVLTSSATYAFAVDGGYFVLRATVTEPGALLSLFEPLADLASTVSAA
ncbi:hypothetical protein [Salinibacterium sp. PAMC 21357]|uniref:hypothetical protein n=1 Tax=Salinibacterium sp. PAMC 21357 TaxID=1112215 RepID=UPI000288CCD7|nr:hypothetical protein [Salinibacterium sp. PAMC 21357]